MITVCWQNDRTSHSFHALASWSLLLASWSLLNFVKSGAGGFAAVAAAAGDGRVVTFLCVHQEDPQQAVVRPAAKLADIGGPHRPPHDDPEADKQASHHREHCKV